MVVLTYISYADKILTNKRSYLVRYAVYYYVQYAIKDNRTVHISEVQNGLDCGCYCTYCNSKLVAKKGNIVVHHFAHYNSVECTHAYESALHAGVKRVLEKEGKFLFPALTGKSLFGNDIELKKSMLLSLDSIKVESRMNTIIPDIIMGIGESECLLEVFVTHHVDKKKNKKIEDLGIAAIELDLSQEDRAIDDEVIKELLIENTKLKKWLFNPKAKALETEMNLKEREKIDRGTIDGFKVTQIKYCFDAIYGCPLLPKHRKYWNISFHEKCFNCKYYISHTMDNLVYCNARHSLWEKLNNVGNKALALNRMSKFEDTRSYLDKLNICPECGNRLVVRKGKKGAFLACKGFPHCKYTRDIDQKTGEVL